MIVAQLLVVDPDTDAYRFRHALIGEVVYAELLPPERRRLHRRIATALRDAGTAPAGTGRSGQRAGCSPRSSRRPAGGVHRVARRRRRRRDGGAGRGAAPPGAGLRAVGRGRRVPRPVPRAAAGCGRRPTSPAGPPATSVPPRSLARRSATDRRRGARRGATNGSGATCGRPGTWRRAPRSSRSPPPCWPHEAGPDAAVVYAGLGQAELMLGPLRLRRRARPSCLRAAVDAGG